MTYPKCPPPSPVICYLCGSPGVMYSFNHPHFFSECSEGSSAGPSCGCGVIPSLPPPLPPPATRGEGCGGGGVKQDPSLVTRECSGVRGGADRTSICKHYIGHNSSRAQTRGHTPHTGQTHELLKTFRHFHKETGLESQSFPPVI